MDEPAPWTTLRSRIAYENPWLRVTEHDVALPDGRTIFYGVVRCRPCVGIVPVLDDEHVLLVRQWRYIVERATWEIPTGGCDAGEDVLAAAQRELREEVRHAAGRLEPLGSFTSSKSVLDETAHLFAAYDLTPDDTGTRDETELLGVAAVPFAQALAWVLLGEIIDAMSIIAILRLDRLRRA